jgi:acetyl-CoA C-acetyltransferase
MPKPIRPTTPSTSPTATTEPPPTGQSVQGVSTSSPIVVLAEARTPIGKLSGSLASFSATELGGFAIRGALERIKAALDRTGTALSDVDLFEIKQRPPSQRASRISTPTKPRHSWPVAGLGVR